MASLRKSSAISIGHVPLIDSAPLLMAKHLGYFENEGVEVSLHEEVGWATIRDKLIHNELSMASTIIGLPYTIHHGIGCYQTKMSIPLIMSANGNTVSITSELKGIDLNNTNEVKQVLNARAQAKGRKWTFATVNPYSSHLILLSDWINTYLKDCVGNIEIVFFPPQLLPGLLQDGMIDGFCAGEPYGTLSENNGAGEVVASSLDLNENHPEKVLAVTQSFLEQNRKKVKSVGKAILRACEDCMNPDNHALMASLLSQSTALGMSSESILNIFSQSYNKKSGKLLHKFYGDNLNCPSPDKEQWTLSGLKRTGLFRKKIIATSQIMQPDLLTFHSR